MPHLFTIVPALLILVPPAQDATPDANPDATRDVTRDAQQFDATPGASELLEEIAHVPFDLSGGRPVPVVEAMVNGQGPFRFFFDTGASACVLDSGFVAELGLETTGTIPLGDPTASARIEADVVRLETLELEGIFFEDVPAVAFDRSALGGDVIRGVLGLPLFHEHLLTLDYAGSRLIVTQETLPEDGEGVVPYSGELLPEVTFRIGAQENVLHLDSGSPTGFTLPTALVETLPLKDEPVLAGRARTVNSELEIWSVQLDATLVVAGMEFVAPRVTYNDRLPRTVLGYQVLKDLELSIDQRSRRVRFAPLRAVEASTKR